MKILNGEELILAAFSKDDYDTWVRAIKKLKDETEQRKRFIDQKHQILDTQGGEDLLERVSKTMSKRADQKRTAEFQTIDLGLE